MSDDFEDDNRPRTLSNLQVLGFVWRRWLEQPGKFAAMVPSCRQLSYSAGSPQT